MEQDGARVGLIFQGNLSLEGGLPTVLSGRARALLRFLQLLQLARQQLLSCRRACQQAASLRLCLLVRDPCGLDALDEAARFVELTLQRIMLLEQKAMGLLSLL